VLKIAVLNQQIQGMNKISTISHHQNKVTYTPMVQDLVFDDRRGEWVVPHQPPAVAPAPLKTNLAPRVATAGKNIVVGGASIVGYGALITLEAAGTILMAVGEFFLFLWLSSRRPSAKAQEQQAMPRKAEKIKVEVNVKIEA
jgi:hypothetical protein